MSNVRFPITLVILSCFLFLLLLLFMCLSQCLEFSCSLPSRRLWEDDSSPISAVDFDYSKPISSRPFPVNYYLSQLDWKERDILFLGERIFSPIVCEQENMWPQSPLAAVLWPQGMMKHALRMAEQRGRRNVGAWQHYFIHVLCWAWGFPYRGISLREYIPIV